MEMGNSTIVIVQVIHTNQASCINTTIQLVHAMPSNSMHTAIHTFINTALNSQHIAM